MRWLWRTRTFTREQVRGFRTDPDWLVPERLWLQLSDGTKVPTPVRRRCATAYRVGDGGTVLAYELRGVPRRSQALDSMCSSLRAGPGQFRSPYSPGLQHPTRPTAAAEEAAGQPRCNCG
ncbi:hypothetical protein V6U89_28065 [Micromonospora sp. CPCC 206171]